MRKFETNDAAAFGSGGCTMAGEGGGVFSGSRAVKADGTAASLTFDPGADGAGDGVVRVGTGVGNDGATPVVVVMLPRGPVTAWVEEVALGATAAVLIGATVCFAAEATFFAGANFFEAVNFLADGFGFVDVSFFAVAALFVAGPRTAGLDIAGLGAAVVVGGLVD